MSGKKARMEAEILRRSLAEKARASRKDTTIEEAVAWAEGIRSQFVRIGGQAAYDKRASEILFLVRKRSTRDGCHPLDAALKYESEVKSRVNIDEDERVVLGALILAVSFLEFHP